MANVQDGSARIEEQFGGGRHVGRIARGAIGSRRGVVRHGGVQLSVADVARQFEQYRPGLAVAQLPERAAHQLRDAIGEVEPPGPLGDVLVGRQRVELGRLTQPMLIRPAGDHQQRDRVGEGLRECAEGIFDAWSSLHDDDCRAGAIARAGIAVGDVDQRLFAARDDGPNAELRGSIDQRVIRIREEVLDPLRLQDLRNRFSTAHRELPSTPFVAC